MTTEKLMSITKEELSEAANNLQKEELSQLVDLLSEKNDKIRYQAFLLLQNRSAEKNDVYPYWDIFLSKLKSENSYQRSIGLMLIAENTRWDQENKMEEAIDDYLQRLNDDKPITIRQCIQALSKVVPYKSNLHNKIAAHLMSIQLDTVRDTMRKLILFDILNILLQLRKEQSDSTIDSYIFGALSGEILDKKSKKLIEASL